MGNEAAQTLRDVERIRKETRSKMNSIWFPLTLFGALTVGSAAVVEISGSPDVGLGIYWMVAGILGGMAVGAYYRRRDLRTGLEKPAAPYIATGVGILVGTSAAGWLGGMNGLPVLAAAGPPLVVAAGYFVFAALDRNAMLAVVATSLVVLVLGMLWSGLNLRDYYSHLTVAYGLILLLSGLGFRALEARQQ